MKCRDCSYWLRDFSMPVGLGYCYAKNCICSESDLCEVFKRRENGTVAIQVLCY